MMKTFLARWRMWNLISASPISRAGLEKAGVDFQDVRPLLVSLYRAGVIGYDQDRQLFLPPGLSQIAEPIKACPNGQATLATLEAATGFQIKPWLDNFVQRGLLTFDEATQAYSLSDLSKYESS